MAAARKFYKKKPVTRCIKSDNGVMSPVITMRISDEEKERIDRIMKHLNIKSYSDVMRMSLHMVQLQRFQEAAQVNS